MIRPAALHRSTTGLGVALLVCAASSVATSSTATASNMTRTYRVVNVADNGAGSLRQAIVDANREPGPARIVFDADAGPFAEPQTITLAGALAPITDDLEIDGYIENRLWKPSGVTISGAGRHRVFEVRRGVRARLRYLTIRAGHADRGGGLLSAGLTRAENLLFLDNTAERGAAIAVSGGRLWLTNTTVVNNAAQRSGGGVTVDGDGESRLTHCTITANRAPRGAGIDNGGALYLANSIIAGNRQGADCESRGTLDPASTHNLIENSASCGTPMIVDDPRLGRLGYYNGPTQSIPLGGRSPAINRGDNRASLDADAAPLLWDQRGNGDPRFAAGIADLGAFERQAVTVLEVDTADDTDLRICSLAASDCSLRGALAIANASPHHSTITFSRKHFTVDTVIEPKRPLPTVVRPLTLLGIPGISIRISDINGPLRVHSSVRVSAKGVIIETAAP